MSDRSRSVIRKYPNRRLYHMGTSTYIVLDDIAEMVRRGDDFVVEDAKTGDDITHSVLIQVAMEKETNGAPLMTTAFLRRLLQFYGSQMQPFVPEFLTASLDQLLTQHKHMQQTVTRSLTEIPTQLLQAQIDSQARLVQSTLKMFHPFAALVPEPAPAPVSEPSPQQNELKELAEQMRAMREQIEALQEAQARKPMATEAAE
jgi:polyhydroxyalkanoate synthesis repressor PhaR